MNQYQLFALGEHLSVWPENMSYSEVIDALKNEDCENITICADFETVWENDLAVRIESFRNHLEQCFIPREVKQ